MSVGAFKRFALLCALASAMLLSGCTRFVVSSGGGASIDERKARAFADGFMDDFANDRRDAMYSKMEKEFHDITSREQFQGLIDTLHEQFGKLTRFEYAREEVGAKMLYTGDTKPMRKIVYQATTTKGAYPLSVTVVPNGNELAVTDFLFTVEIQ